MESVCPAGKVLRRTNKKVGRDLAKTEILQWIGGLVHMPFYVSLAKIISNRRALETFVITYLPIFSKNFYDF